MITSPMKDQLKEEEIYENTTNRTYIKGKELGKGAFAKVFKFIDKETQHVYAAKIIEASKINTNRATSIALMNEKDINKKINFDYICQFVQFFNDKNNYYIVLEYYPNKTLADLLKTRKMLSEFEVKYYGYQLLLAMEYLHSKSIIHRDIKLSNILLSSEMEVKLCDFGLAVENSLNQKRKSVCGTPNYIAPEVLVNGKKTRHRPGYGLEVDVWSFGVVLYTLLCGKPPFEGKDNKDIEFNIINNKYVFPRNDLAEEAKSLIQQMLVTNPEKRIKLNEIKGSVFFNNGRNIPRTLPTSTLTTPLTNAEIEELIEKAKENPYLDLEDVEDKYNCLKTFGINSISQSTIKESICDDQSPKINSGNCNNKGTMPEFIIKIPQKSSKDKDKDRDGNSSGQQRSISTGRFTSNQQLHHLNSSSNNTGNGTKNNTNVPKAYNSNIFNASSSYLNPNLNPNPDLNSNKQQQLLQHHNEENKMNSNDDIAIVNFIDYSNKYGVGYLLNNSNIGVYFNDGTKMLYDTSSLIIYSISKEGVISKLPHRHYPNELETKVKLLDLFKQALLLPQKQPIANSREDALIYVRKWQKKEQASFYLFSNKTIQVIFKDTTELFFVFLKNKVKYIDLMRVCVTYSFNSPLIQVNGEMSKKVNYAKHILAST